MQGKLPACFGHPWSVQMHRTAWCKNEQFRCDPHGTVVSLTLHTSDRTYQHSAHNAIHPPIVVLITIYHSHTINKHKSILKARLVYQANHVCIISCKM